MKTASIRIAVLLLFCFCWNARADKSAFLYQINFDDATLSFFSVDEINGTPQFESYRNITANSVAITPSKEFVLIGTTGSGVESMRVDFSTGQLTRVAGSPFAAGGVNASGVAVHPSGSTVYALSLASENVTAFSIGADGVLSSLGTVATGSAPERVLVHPNGQFVYVVNRVNPGISIFHVEANGSLTAAGNTPFGVAPAFAIIDPTGSFLYASDTGASGIQKFQINADGSLTSLGKENSTGTCRGLSFHPEANRMYAACSSGINVYSFDPSDGELGVITGSPFGGSNTFSVAIDEDGRYLYSSHRTEDLVKVFQIDPVTGGLNETGSATGWNGGGEIILAQNDTRLRKIPKFAYASGFNGNAISAFEVGATGTFSSLSGSPFTVTGPRPLALHPFKPLLFSGSGASSNTFAWNTDLVTGALSLVSGSPVVAGGGHTQMDVEPSGRFLYVSNFGPDNVSMLPIQSNGALGAATDTAAGNGPAFTELDPRGKFLYVGNGLGDTIQQYEINEANGTLTPIATLSHKNPVGMAFHPSGLLAYASDGFADEIVAYSVNPEDGSLTDLNLEASVFQIQGLAMHPSGRFLYAAGGSNIFPFSINQAAGSLALIGDPVQTTNGVSTLRVEGSGKFLFVTSQLGNELSTYGINPTTGELSLVQTDHTVSGASDVVIQESKSILTPQSKDHFSDNDVSDWTFLKTPGTVVDGDLKITTTKKADAISPLPFCSVCTYETVLRIETDVTSVSLFGWFVDKKSQVELAFQPKKQKVLLKQKLNGKHAKATAQVAFLVNQDYHIRLGFDGTQFHVEVDGIEILTLNSAGAPDGTAAFRIKPKGHKTSTAAIRYIQVY